MVCVSSVPKMKLLELNKSVLNCGKTTSLSLSLWVHFICKFCVSTELITTVDLRKRHFVMKCQLTISETWVISTSFLWPCYTKTLQIPDALALCPRPWGNSPAPQYYIILSRYDDSVYYQMNTNNKENKTVRLFLVVFPLLSFSVQI